MFDSMDVDNKAYQIKPMNCPFHVLTYKHELHSYRELPLRWAELGTVYRYERSGALHGLMRVRGFTQDDAHVFCLPDQIAAEILRVLNLTEQILSDFGFHDYEINLSTRPEKSVGADEVWELATRALIEALNAKSWNYSIDEGGGAFYGPKIDLKIKDAIGRLWQCSTIPVDFNLPERLGKMIRTAELEKIPVVGVIGMKEMETQTLSIRTRKGGDLGILTLEDLHQKMQQAIQIKSSL